jgi:hypothetical protein
MKICSNRCWRFFSIFATKLKLRMRNAHNCLLLAFPIVAVMLITGCKTTGLTKEQQAKQFEKMGWLIGCWQNISSETSITEEWKKLNDTAFLGTSMMISGADTLYREQIKLAPSGINIYYAIISHNVEKTLNSSYLLKKNQGGKLVFEDPGNKEQSRLTYVRKSNDRILLKIEGLDGNKTSVETYDLKRIVK